MAHKPQVEVFHQQDIESSHAESSEPWHPFLQRPGLLAGLYQVAPGKSDQETHGVHEQDEVYYVIRGAGKICANRNDYALSPGTVVFVKAGIVHYFYEVSEELLLLVFFSG